MNLLASTFGVPMVLVPVTSRSQREASAPVQPYWIPFGVMDLPPSLAGTIPKEMVTKVLVARFPVSPEKTSLKEMQKSSVAPLEIKAMLRTLCNGYVFKGRTLDNGGSCGLRAMNRMREELEAFSGDSFKGAKKLINGVRPSTAGALG
jgi:hypothetical protein